MLIKNAEITREKASFRLFIACWVAYAVICLSKNAYSASIASIIQAEIFDKPKAGLINSAYWAVYALSQFFGVKLINRFSPVHFITVALCGTAFVNIGMAMSESFGAMLFFWSLCGLLQFATWPATVRIIVEYLADEHKKKAMTFISFAQCAGLLLNYFSAAIVLKFASWNMIFVVSVGILLITLCFWLFTTGKNTKVLCPADKKEKTALEEKKADIKLGKLILTSGLLFILIPSFIRGALDNGVKTWVPTMITESYGVSASISNILTMLLLVINLSGVFICSFLYPKRIKNLFTAYGVCFAVACPMTIALLMIGKIPVIVVVLLLAGITTMMYAGYQMNYVILPACFASHGKSGGIASILNAVASFGVLTASYGFGFLAEHTGWTGTISVWAVMTVVATACCMLGSFTWSKFRKKE